MGGIQRDLFLGMVRRVRAIAHIAPATLIDTSHRLAQAKDQSILSQWIRPCRGRTLQKWNGSLLRGQWSDHAAGGQRFAKFETLDHLCHFPSNFAATGAAFLWLHAITPRSIRQARIRTPFLPAKTKTPLYLRYRGE